MAFRDGTATVTVTATIHSGKLRSIDAVTEMQLRSIRHDRYTINSPKFYPDPKSSISDPVVAVSHDKKIPFMRNMDSEGGAVLT